MDVRSERVGEYDEKREVRETDEDEILYLVDPYAQSGDASCPSQCHAECKICTPYS